VSRIALIRCEKNEDRCPLTGCFQCLDEKKEGFAHYTDAALVGVFTCKCPGDKAVALAKILKSKGAEVIHFCTCTFATKTGNGWDMTKGGFCSCIDEIIDRVHQETDLSCVKGSAHLPAGYTADILV